MRAGREAPTQADACDSAGPQVRRSALLLPQRPQQPRVRQRHEDEFRRQPLRQQALDLVEVAEHLSGRRSCGDRDAGRATDRLAASQLAANAQADLDAVGPQLHPSAGIRWPESAVNARGQAAAAVEAIEELERKASRKKQGTRTDIHPAKLAESSKGEAHDKVAAGTAKGRSTLAKIKEAVAAAKADPRK